MAISSSWQVLVSSSHLLAGSQSIFRKCSSRTQWAINISSEKAVAIKLSCGTVMYSRDYSGAGTAVYNHFFGVCNFPFLIVT